MFSINFYFITEISQVTYVMQGWGRPPQNHVEVQSAIKYVNDVNTHLSIIDFIISNIIIIYLEMLSTVLLPLCFK